MSRKYQRQTGRPSSLDEATEKRLLDAVRAGTPLSKAALYAGVGYSTVCRWVARGAEEQERLDAGLTAADRLDQGAPPEARERPFVEFRDKLLRARADLEVGTLAVVNKVARGGYVLKEVTRRYRNEDGQMVTEKETVRAQPDWRAAKWLLETSFREDFGPAATETVLTVQDGGQRAGVSAAQVVHLADRLHQLMAAAPPELEAGEEDPETVDAELVEDAG